MISMTNTIIEQGVPLSLQPITSRWNRKYTEISEFYYYWTVTRWETKDPIIQKLLDDGILEETEKTYKLMKPLILDQQSLCLDKSIIFDEKIGYPRAWGSYQNMIMNQCNIIKKNTEDAAIIINTEIKK